MAETGLLASFGTFRGRGCGADTDCERDGQADWWCADSQALIGAIVTKAESGRLRTDDTFNYIAGQVQEKEM